MHGQKFIVRQLDPVTGKTVRYTTPLLLALAMVEFVDLVFAVDSIPAIFAITTDPYIVYTSNIFAILGLRALFRPCGEHAPFRLSEICDFRRAGVYRLKNILESAVREN